MKKEVNRIERHSECDGELSEYQYRIRYPILLKRLKQLKALKHYKKKLNNFN